MMEFNPKTNLLAIVPVRAGSKGLPGKNVMCLGGVPLYLRAVQQGVRTVGNAILSTDILNIEDTELPRQCTLCRRPQRLATDKAQMAEVIADLLENIEDVNGKTIVLLQATSPLRSDNDIAAAIALHAEGNFDLVMSVTERDQGILKNGILDNNRFVALSEPRYCFSNRQTLPRVYGPNGAIYVFSAALFMKERDFPTSRIGVVDMPNERSLDIDTIDDFKEIERRFNLSSLDD